MAGHLSESPKGKDMKAYFLALFTMTGFLNCNNSRSDPKLKDPSTVQPSLEAITDSTKLVNDFVMCQIQLQQWPAG